MSDANLIERVRQLIYDADPEIPAAAVVAAVREAIAAEIETAGEAAQVEYDKCEAFHALSPMTCSRLSEARFFARLVRRGEQQ